MNAEQTLSVHFAGIVESRDPAGYVAFADHLIERWQQAIDEDAEYHRETGYSPLHVVLCRLPGGLCFGISYHSQSGFLVECWRQGVTGRRYFTHGLDNDPKKGQPPPTEWDYERVMAFVNWLWTETGPDAVQMCERCGGTKPATEFQYGGATRSTCHGCHRAEQTMTVYRQNPWGLSHTDAVRRIGRRP